MCGSRCKREPHCFTASMSWVGSSGELVYVILSKHYWTFLAASGCSSMCGPVIMCIACQTESVDTVFFVIYLFPQFSLSPSLTFCISDHLSDIYVVSVAGSLHSGGLPVSWPVRQHWRGHTLCRGWPCQQLSAAPQLWENLQCAAKNMELCSGKGWCNPEHKC